jgi:hypothetical protein
LLEKLDYLISIILSILAGLNDLYYCLALADRDISNAKLLSFTPSKTFKFKKIEQEK